MIRKPPFMIEMVASKGVPLYAADAGDNLRDRIIWDAVPGEMFTVLEIKSVQIGYKYLLIANDGKLFTMFHWSASNNFLRANVLYSEMMHDKPGTFTKFKVVAL